MQMAFFASERQQRFERNSFGTGFSTPTFHQQLSPKNRKHLSNRAQAFYIDLSLCWKLRRRWGIRGWGDFDVIALAEIMQRLTLPPVSLR